jgi:ABC-type polysaccharide/polyol phosphate export permease
MKKLKTPEEGDNFLYLLAGLLLLLLIAPSVAFFLSVNWSFLVDIAFAVLLVMGVWGLVGVYISDRMSDRG